MILLDEHQVRPLLSCEALIPAMREALIELSSGRVVQPVRLALEIPNRVAWLGVMPAIYRDVMGAKLVSVYPDNASNGLPTHQALIQLFRSANGEPIAIMDGRLITEMRTAAVSALATDLLAPEDARVLALLGSGVQARSHFEALRLVRRFEEVRVWSRTPASAERFAAETGARATSAEEAVGGADVIVTATYSPTPVLRGEWLKERCHINAIGAVGPTRRELDDAALRGYLVVDSREAACQESGDLILSGTTPEAELGELLAGGRSVPHARRTIFKSVGLAVEDVAAAKLVYEASLSAR